MGIEPKKRMLFMKFQKMHLISVERRRHSRRWKQTGLSLRRLLAYCKAGHEFQLLMIGKRR
jgi:hypothetical protein